MLKKRLKLGNEAACGRLETQLHSVGPERLPMFRVLLYLFVHVGLVFRLLVEQLHGLGRTANKLAFFVALRCWLGKCFAQHYWCSQSSTTS